MSCFRYGSEIHAEYNCLSHYSYDPSLSNQLINDEICYVKSFFKNQEKLPPAMSSRTCMIYCPCKLCSTITW